MSEEFELQIDSIAAGGDGVGRHNGLVVFVPRTAPRDVANVRAVKQDRLMRGDLLSLVSPSPSRTTPSCEHYTVDRCGGCQLQHMDYAAQLTAKAGIIRDTMTRIGKRDVELPRVAPSELQWRYRSKLTLALRRANGGWIAGLRRYDAPDEVFPLRDCPITDDRVLKFWKSVLTRAEFLPSARELRASLRLIDTGFAFTVEGGESWTSSSALFESIPEMLELWWQPLDQRRRLEHSRTTTDRTGASFVQVNAGVRQASRLRPAPVCSNEPTHCCRRIRGLRRPCRPARGRGHARHRHRDRSRSRASLLVATTEGLARHRRSRGAGTA